MKIKKLLGLIAAPALLLALALLPNHARAAGITYQANANWNQSTCTADINGITQDEKNGYGVAQGDDVTLNLKNNSNIALVIAISLGDDNVSPSGDLAAGATYSHTYSNLQSNLEVQAAADGYTNPCGFKNMTDGEVTVLPGSATLSCATVLGNKGYGWDLTGNFSNVVDQASLFEGSTNVDSFTYGGGSLSGENFVAGSSATTFYFYDGFTASDRLLAQATCQPPASSSSSGNSSSSTSKSTTTTSTALTASPTSTPQSATSAVAATSSDPVQLQSVNVSGQPINSGKPLELKQTQALTLTGNTIPNGTVTLTFHSTPKTVSVKADSAGKWSLTVTGLAPGNHFVDASVMAPGAKQASITTKLVAFKVDPVAAVAKKSSSKNTWLIIVLALMVLAIAGAVFYFFGRRKQPKNPANVATPPSSPEPPVDVNKQNPDKSDKPGQNSPEPPTADIGVEGQDSSDQQNHS